MNITIKIKTAENVSGDPVLAGGIFKGEGSDQTDANPDTGNLSLNPFTAKVTGIGIGYIDADDNNNQVVISDFCIWEHNGDEALMLNKFSEKVDNLASRFGNSITWVTWNGRTFDIPFLYYRLLLNGIQNAAFVDPGLYTGFAMRKPLYNGGVYEIYTSTGLRALPYPSLHGGCGCKTQQSGRINMLNLVSYRLGLDMIYQLPWEDMVFYDPRLFGVENPENKEKLELDKRRLLNEVGFLMQLKAKLGSETN